MRRKAQTSLVVLLTLVVGTGSAVLGARPASAATGWYHMWNPYSNKCLDNWGSYNANTPVRQYNCWNGNQQLWRTIYYSGDAFGHWDVIQNAWNGQCLAVANGRTTTQGQPVIQTPCNVNDMAQNFFARYSGNSDWGLSATCTTRTCGGLGQPTYYLLTEASRSNGNPATITYSNGSSAQLWEGVGL